MAEIIKHNEAEDLADMPEHPIPSLVGLDLMIVNKCGGADLVIVIADPIEDDKFSQERLLQKLANYFNFINSDLYIEQSGVKPDVNNTKVIVKIHPSSSGVYSELVSNCLSWAEEKNSALELRILTDTEMGVE